MQLYFLFTNLQRHVSPLRSYLQAEHKSVYMYIYIYIFIYLFIYLFILQCRKMDKVSFTLSY